MPIISASGRHWQESFYKFKSILGYIVRPCLKTKRKSKTRTRYGDTHACDLVTIIPVLRRVRQKILTLRPAWAM